MAYDPAPLPENYAQPYPSQPAGTEYDVTTLVRFLLEQGYGGAAGLMPSLSGPNAALMGGFAPLAEDLGTTAATNLFQDQMTIMMDPAMGVFGGPGAYAPDAFDDVMSYETIDTPWVSTLDRYAQNPDSIEGMIAQHILAGGTASSAYSLIMVKANRAQAAIDADEEPEAGDARILEMIPPSPGRIDQFTGELVPGSAGPNFGWIMEKAEEMEGGYAEDIAKAGMSGAMYDDEGNMISAGGTREWVTDENGNRTLVEVTSTPSDPAEYYNERGLSLPTDEWSASLLMGDDWEAQAGLVQELGALSEADRQRYLGLEASVPTAARRSEINEMLYPGPTVGDVRRVERPDLSSTATNGLGAVNGALEGAGGWVNSVGEWLNQEGASPTSIPGAFQGLVGGLGSLFGGGGDEGGGVPSTTGGLGGVGSTVMGGGGGGVLSPEQMAPGAEPGVVNLDDLADEGGFIAGYGGGNLTADMRAMLSALVPRTSAEQNSGTLGYIPLAGDEPEPEPYDYDYWSQPIWQRDPMQMPGVAQDPTQGPPMGPPSRTGPGYGEPPVGDTYLPVQPVPGYGAPPVGDTFLPPQPAGAPAGTPPTYSVTPGAQPSGITTPAAQPTATPATVPYVIDPSTPGGISIIPQGNPQYPAPRDSATLAQMRDSPWAKRMQWNMTLVPPSDSATLAAMEGGVMPYIPQTPGPESLIRDSATLARMEGEGRNARPDRGPGSEQPEYLEWLRSEPDRGPGSEQQAYLEWLRESPRGRESAMEMARPGPDRGPGSEQPEYLEWLRESPRGSEPASEMAMGSRPSSVYSGPLSGIINRATGARDRAVETRDRIAAAELRAFNAEGAERARGNRNRVSREAEDAFRTQLRSRAVSDRARERTYGYDYGRAQAIAYLLNSTGLSPTTLQMAQRGLPAAAAGVRRG